MEVETYESGESFLLSTVKREPDCLIVDIRMSGMSGPELRDRLVAMGRHIPVVFITAHAEDSGAVAGTAEVLRKPFGDDALLAAIQRAIHRRKGVSR